MESWRVLAILAIVALAAGSPPIPMTTAAPQTTSAAAPDTNSTEPGLVRSFIIRFRIPFFGSIPSNDEDSSAEDSQQSDMKLPEENTPEDGPIGSSLFIFRTFSFSDDSDSDSVSDSSSRIEGPNPAEFPFFSDSLLNALFKPAALDLSGKSLTGAELSDLLSAQMMPVTKLILSNTRIEGLTTESFAPVQNSLRELVMDNCSIPLSALNQLSNLRVLNASNNGLSTFEWFPQYADSLEILDLSHNFYTELRPELSALTNLKELYLSYNRISSLPENPLKKLSNLEILSLSMNRLYDADLTGLDNLQQADLDWNYLRLLGEDLLLPSHRLSLKLASNPWRCDCGILEARDSYDVLDLEHLKCANQLSYSLCTNDDCKRYFLPEQNGRLVANLTKDSIQHLGCTGLLDQYYLFKNGFTQIREHEPEKLARLMLLALTVLILLVAAVLACRKSSAKSKFDRQTWWKVQQVPHVTIEKLHKPSEVPYEKIGSPDA